MTNELEKTFFDTFGIEPILKTFAIQKDEQGELTYPPIYEYPQFTDRIWLGLICILSEWRQYCDSDYVIKAINIDNLKEDILKDCLYMSNWYEFKKCGKDIKHQVRKLFEEEK